MLRSLKWIPFLIWPAVSLSAEAPVRLEIANGHGVPGVVEEAAQEYNSGSFRVVAVGDAPTYKYGQTFVLYRQGFDQAAEALAARLPVKGWLRRTGSLDDGVDIRLLLGRDYAWQASRLAAEREAAAAAVAREAAVSQQAPRLEVSNGNGVAGMASRVRFFLQEQKWPVTSLTNADSYDYPRSLIYFRPGLRRQAAELASVLPVGNVRLVENARQSVELRLVLGRDFVSYDTNRLGGTPQVAGE